MTLAQLEIPVALYLRTASNPDVPAYFGTGFNLFITAANNARLRAEKMHNWYHLATEAKLVVDNLNGVALSTAVELSDGATAVDINQITRAYILGDDGKTQWPLDLVDKTKTTSDTRQEQQKTPYGYGGNGSNLQLDMGIYPPYPAYPYLNFRELPRVMRMGDRIYMWPKGEAGTTTNVVLDVVKRSTPYPLTAYGAIEDWFLKNGSDYMLWATICEMNFLYKEFVGRQEGNLTVPTSSRDEALDLLITNDTFSSVSASEHFKD